MKYAITIAIAALMFASTPAFAGGEMKEVCKEKTDKAGKVVNDKAGKPVQVCKKIKVHKKLEKRDVVTAQDKYDVAGK